MTTNQTIYFTCPNCDERFAQVEELDRDIHTGEIYHCLSCGLQMIFQAASAEDYVPPPGARRDCRFCNPDPLFIHPYKTTYSEIGKENHDETCSAG